MAYLSICDKFGETRVFWTAVGAPQILYWGLTAAFQKASGVGIPILSEFLGAAVILASSVVGFLAAHISHDIDEGRLSSEGVGTTRGSHVIQRGQLKAYFTTMKYGLAASTLSIVATSWMFDGKSGHTEIKITMPANHPQTHSPAQ